ncbi:MAG: hypothetical protein KGN84_06580 [Acidobacteriota bacterium]|nr:hypothetical protein [Acidobacteriota bacterium]
MSSSAELRGVVERFVARAGQPALLDPGEEPFRLVSEQWSLSEWNGRVLLQAWDERRNLVCKIAGVKEQRRDRLTLYTERFPKTQGEMQIADLTAPGGFDIERRSSRVAFRERFRFMLAREFPGWRVEEVSCEANLEQSLGPSFVRAFLRMGSNGIAAIAAPPGSLDPAGIVAFGIVWAGYLRKRERAAAIRRLLLFCPAHTEKEIAHRASVVNPAVLECGLYAFDEKDRLGAVDFLDVGNVESSLPPCRRPVLPNLALPEFPEMPDVDRVELSDGSVSLRVRGLEFARWAQGKLSCGIARRKRCGMDAVAAMAREIARVRTEGAEDRQHPLYAQYPEGWLESLVRANPGAVDASLLRAPIYGQVPVFGGRDSGVIDLLGVDHTGRLVVIELKAAADLQLPFQAIDYWLRVRKHLAAGDFARLGYFPGITVREDAPRILLVAPSLEFHSTSETILRCLHPGIEVERVGLAANWRSEVRIMFRLRGAELP